MSIKPPPSLSIGIDPVTNQAPARPVTLSTIDVAKLDTTFRQRNSDVPASAFSNNGITNGPKADTAFASRANNETKAEATDRSQKGWCGTPGCTSCGG